MAEARALLDGIPITADTAEPLPRARRGRGGWRCSSSTSGPTSGALTRKLAPFTILQPPGTRRSRQVSKELAEGEQKIAEKIAPDRARDRAAGAVARRRRRRGAGRRSTALGAAGACRATRRSVYLLRAYGERNQITLEDGRKVPVAPGRQAVAEAMDQLEAMAYAGPRRPAPALRVGGDGARLVLDLCRDDYTVVVVDGAGLAGGEAEPAPDAAGDGHAAAADARRGAATRSATCASCSASTVTTRRVLGAARRLHVRGAAPRAAVLRARASRRAGHGQDTTAQVIRAPSTRTRPTSSRSRSREDDLFVNCRRPVAHRLRQPVSTLDAALERRVLPHLDGRRATRKRKLLHRPRHGAVQGRAPPDHHGDRRRGGGARPARPRAAGAAARDRGDRRIDEDELMAATSARSAPRVLGQLLDAAARRAHDVSDGQAARRCRAWSGPTQWIEAGGRGARAGAPGSSSTRISTVRARAGEMALEASRDRRARWIDMLAWRELAESQRQHLPGRRLRRARRSSCSSELERASCRQAAARLGLAAHPARHGQRRCAGSPRRCASSATWSSSSETPGTQEA